MHEFPWDAATWRSATALSYVVQSNVGQSAETGTLQLLIVMEAKHSVEAEAEGEYRSLLCCKPCPTLGKHIAAKAMVATEAQAHDKCPR